MGFWAELRESPLQPLRRLRFRGDLRGDSAHATLRDSFVTTRMKNRDYLAKSLAKHSPRSDTIVAVKRSIKIGAARACTITITLAMVMVEPDGLGIHRVRAIRTELLRDAKQSVAPTAQRITQSEMRHYGKQISLADGRMNARRNGTVR